MGAFIDVCMAHNIGMQICSMGDSSARGRRAQRACPVRPRVHRYKSSLDLSAFRLNKRMGSKVFRAGDLCRAGDYVDYYVIHLLMPASSRRRRFAPLPAALGIVADCKAPASPRRSAPGSPRRLQMLDPLEPKPLLCTGQQQWPGVGGDLEDVKGVAADFEAQGGVGGVAGPAESKRSSGHGGEDYGGESDDKVCLLTRLLHYRPGNTFYTHADMHTCEDKQLGGLLLNGIDKREINKSHNG